MRRHSVMAALAAGVLVVLASCNPAATITSPTTPSGYAASTKASAIDGRSTAWVKNAVGAEEWSGVTPTVVVSYEPNAGDEGTNDGAAKLTYSGESGTTMQLSVFSMSGPKALSTSGSQTLGAKVKPVAGCVCKAVAFVSENGSGEGSWHESSEAFTLAPDSWTTVSVSVDATSFAAGVYRVGIVLIGNDSDAPFAASGTVYIDDFSPLDLRKNEFSSSAQLVDTCYQGTGSSAGTITPSWEASSSTAGDGCLVEDVTFPSTIPADTGWGAWVGSDFANDFYGTYTPADLSASTLTVRMYVSQEAHDALQLENTVTWLSLYDDAQTSVQIWYAALSIITVGWNTISINFADSRLHDGNYVSGNTAYDFSSVKGFNIGIGSMNPAMADAALTVKLDWVDVTQN
ncbi:MAG TPA: hypothetical protein VHE79_08230 [Spirochaetia bacterium]